MRQGSIGVAREGYPLLFLLAFSAVIFAMIGCWPMAVILLAGVWFTAHFFRDPERVVPTENGIAVSPADGRIVAVAPAPCPFTGQSLTRVSIFMNVCNVHVNRSPVAGRIKAVSYYPGKFFNASLDKASTDNERCAYAIEAKDGTFAMVQIAGLVARRIVCRVEEGEKLNRGERVGLIRFGSRVDLYLPEGYSPCVAVGEKVTAGGSVVARRNAL